MKSIFLSTLPNFFVENKPKIILSRDALINTYFLIQMCDPHFSDVKKTNNSTILDNSNLKRLSSKSSLSSVNSANRKSVTMRKRSSSNMDLCDRKQTETKLDTNEISKIVDNLINLKLSQLQINNNKQVSYFHNIYSFQVSFDCFEMIRKRLTLMMVFQFTGVQ